MAGVFRTRRQNEARAVQSESGFAQIWREVFTSQTAGGSLRGPRRGDQRLETQRFTCGCGEHLILRQATSGQRSALRLTGATFPFQAWPVDTEADKSRVFHFGNVDSAPVGTTETQVAGLFSEYVNFLQNGSVRGHFHNGAFAVPSYVEIAIHVDAHAIESVIGKLSNQSLVGQAAIGPHRKRPHVLLHAFVNVESFSIGAEIYAIGGAHVCSHFRDFAG